MTEETLLAMKHNIFTPGNYFYNGIGHCYRKILGSAASLVMKGS